MFRLRPLSSYRLIGVAVFILLTTQALLGFASPFSTIVVFGDSLEDSGNLLARHQLPPSPPYFEGRLSNGPVWVERLAERLTLPPILASELGGTNYAWAAATTGSIRGEASGQVDDIDVQIRKYLRSTEPDGGELYVISGGWNDLYAGQTDLSKIAETINGHIVKLRSAGGRSFIVVNIQANAGKLAPLLNGEVAGHLASLRNEFEDLDIFELDHASLFDAVVADPASFGFVSATISACADCGVGVNANPTEVVDNPNEYFLWDDVHPTASFHRMLGDAAFRTIIPVGDFDFDRGLTLADVGLLTGEIIAGENAAEFDVTGDSVVNENDLSFWVKDLKQTWFGDANLDGEFNSGDLIIALAAGTYEAEVDADWASGDFDGNGRFDSGDLVLALADGGYEAGPRPASNAVPEPSTRAFLLVGLLIFVATVPSSTVLNSSSF